MQVHCLRIDRGAVEDSVGLGDVAARVRLAFLSRAGRIALPGPHATVWVAIRGGWLRPGTPASRQSKRTCRPKPAATSWSMN